MLRVLILRLRWWVWNLLADHGPDFLWGLADRICPSDRELDFLDSLDAKSQ